MRALLILTCSTVSLSHGTNDGQKSIGLIMLTIIGLLPATYALNPQASGQIASLAQLAADARPLIAQYGDDVKDHALQSVDALQSAQPGLQREADALRDRAQPSPEERGERARLRGYIYDVMSELRFVGEQKPVDDAHKRHAGELLKKMGGAVSYAPWWVRILSAVCLGIGTMIGYRRVVRTLGERLGRQHMTPGQGASAELVGSILIGTAGLTGLPVSTTHIITSGIAGTMAASGQGVQKGMIARIVLTWVITMPVTIAVAGALFYVLASPRF